MRHRRKIAVVASLAVMGGLVTAVAQEPGLRVDFPTDYATSFKNYLSLDRVQNHDQIIRLFANDVALQGPGEDGRLPAGSVLVAEIYRAKKDQDGNVITSSLGQRIADGLAAIGVMEKREGWGADIPEELRNGDWDFAIFSPAGERLDRDLDACRACHAPLTDTDHLFSIEHLAR